MSRNRVRIHAPPEGCAPFTSTRRAAYYVRQGRAVLVDGELHFHGPTPEFYQRLQTAKFEQAVAERGQVYWNGSRKHGACKPGVARS
jgi:hypothetical protein